MKTLVTGHQGFIGKHLAKQIDFIGLDLKDGLNLLSAPLPDVDCIYHLAAQSSVEASWADPVHDSSNLVMMVCLVKAYPNARIIYTNTAAPKNSSPYGFSKHSAADYLRVFHKDYVICRLPNIYGPGSHSVVDIFKGQDEVIVYGDGHQTRDYVHVDDIVEGLLKARDWPVGDYQLGSEIGTTVLKLAEGKVAHFREARKEARESILGNNTPNWKPKIKVTDYLCS